MENAVFPVFCWFSYVFSFSFFFSFFFFIFFSRFVLVFVCLMPSNLVWSPPPVWSNAENPGLAPLRSGLMPKTLV